MASRDGKPVARYPLHTLQGIISFSYAGASPALMGKCAEYGIITGLEAMNTRESNIMNLQAQAIGLASDTDRPNICLLADFYHFSLGGEDPSVIDQGKKLVHTHISNPDGRVYLQPTDRADYASFFSALARIGYHGRMSYEGKLKDDERELTVTLATMKKLAADAGI